MSLRRAFVRYLLCALRGPSCFNCLPRSQLVALLVGAIFRPAAKHLAMLCCRPVSLLSVLKNRQGESSRERHRAAVGPTSTTLFLLLLGRLLRGLLLGGLLSGCHYLAPPCLASVSPSVAASRTPWTGCCRVSKTRQVRVVIGQRIMLLVVTTHLNVCIQPTFAMFRQGELANLKKDFACRAD
jgi:hypothetical protein